MSFIKSISRSTSPLIAFGLGFALFPAEWRRGKWETRQISYMNESAMKKIQSFPLYQRLDQDQHVEKKYHSEAFPSQHKQNHVGSGLLFGPNLFEIDPVLFVNESAGEMTGFYHLGKSLISQDGRIHNGVTATILDEGLCRCGFGRLPNGKGVTANLSFEFHNQAPPDSTVVLHAQVQSAEGRKVVITGNLSTLPLDDEVAAIDIASARCVLVEPKWFRYLAWLGL